MEKNEWEIETDLYNMAALANINKEKLDIEYQKEKRQGNIAKFGLYISLFAAMLTIYGVSKSKSTVTEYMTTKEIYSNEEIEQTKQKPEYLKKIDGLEKTMVVEYGPWIYEDENKYCREIYSYDVTNSSVNEENYLNYDLSGFDEKVKIETRYNPIYLDEYDRNLRELVILTQDPNNKRIITDEITLFLTGVETTFGSVIALLSLSLIYKSKYEESILMTNKINRKIKHGKKLSKYENSVLENRRRISKQLYKKYISYSQQFIIEYKKYRDVINNEELEKKYQSLIRKKH